jgi:hypothetical protein
MGDARAIKKAREMLSNSQIWSSIVSLEAQLRSLHIVWRMQTDNDWITVSDQLFAFFLSFLSPSN